MSASFCKIGLFSSKMNNPTHQEQNSADEVIAGKFRDIVLRFFGSFTGISE